MGNLCLSKKTAKVLEGSEFSKSRVIARWVGVVECSRNASLKLANAFSLQATSRADSDDRLEWNEAWKSIKSSHLTRVHTLAGIYVYRTFVKEACFFTPKFDPNGPLPQTIY